MDREALVEENLGLVYLMAHRQIKRGSAYSFEELESLGLEGLWSAALKWDPDREAFTTYACRCIQNNFNRQYKHDHREMRNGTTVSLDETTLRTDGGAEKARLDKIASPMPGPEETALDRERAREIEAALCLLQARERACIKMRYGFEGEEMGWREIGERLGITRQAAQQCGSRGMKRLKRLLEARRKSGAEI